MLWLMTPGSRSKLLLSSLLILGVLAAGWVAVRGLAKKESPAPVVAESVVVEEVEVTEVQMPRAPEAPASPATASAGVFDKIASEVSGVYEKAAPAVVRIRATDGPEQLAGTGFLVDNQGTVLTAYAVVGQAKEVTVDAGGRTYTAKILGRDPRSGVACLKSRAGKPRSSFWGSPPDCVPPRRWSAWLFPMISRRSRLSGLWPDSTSNT